MTKYFMHDTHLAGLEAEMMLVPFFTQRTSGVMILSRFHYDKKSTNCKDCVSYHKGCTETVCPWLAERLEAGTVSYRELLKICFENLRNKRMKVRLRRLSSCCGCFYDSSHKRRFQMAQATLGVNLSSMPPTVNFVDDACGINMTWDNGRTLALLPDQDQFSVIASPEPEQQMGGMKFE